MTYDIVPPALVAQRHQLRKWFKTLTNRGGVYDGRAVLLVVNLQAPELSYLTTAKL